jgi:predicted membrane protein
MQYDERGALRVNHGIIPALIVIGVGVLFLLSNLDIFHIRELWRYWPVLLIAAGLAKLVDAESDGGRSSGAVLLVVGGLFLANNLGFVRLTWHDFWPLILIGAGLLMLWNRLNVPTLNLSSAGGAPEGMLNLHAIFGGVERKVTTDDFRGGQITAIFGGVEINLRRAAMRGDTAVLQIDALFGGVEVKVPATWMVVVEGTSVFGGFSDETAHPSIDSPGLKRLVLKGGAVFGGVSVKN